MAPQPKTREEETLRTTVDHLELADEVEADFTKVVLQKLEEERK